MVPVLYISIFDSAVISVAIIDMVRVLTICSLSAHLPLLKNRFISEVLVIHRRLTEGMVTSMWHYWLGVAIAFFGASLSLEMASVSSLKSNFR